jgi:hypothetical protein
LDLREKCCEDGSCKNRSRWSADVDFGMSGAEPSTSTSGQSYPWQEPEYVRLGVGKLALGNY